jgi:glycosyltransferase involved in cell wall biosynthesis
MSELLGQAQPSHVIAYGGDHAVAVDAATVDEYDLSESYAFAVCRIEPENNVHMVLEAFARLKPHALVIMGNWNNSEYGRSLREQYARFVRKPLFARSDLRCGQAQDVAFVGGGDAFR